MNIVKKFLPLIILLALSYWAIAPFFHNGFFPIHDDTQVQRVFEMGKSLGDGMFPVRWVADLGFGYGYPIFNFYAPFAYYVAGVISLTGFNALIATKVTMALGIVLAGVSMYLFAREFWGESGGLLSGLLYLYAPYHAIDVYVRGDFAEFWAYAFIPLVFLAIYKVYRYCGSIRTMTKSAWLWVGIGALAYAVIISSHNLTAMMVTPFLFVWGFLFYIQLRFSEKKHQPYFILLILLLGIGLATFYWLPTLTELKYTNVLSQIGGGADYHDHFVCLDQLWNSPWGFGGSTRGCIADGLSFRIGKIHILLSLLSLLGIVLLWKKERTKATILLFSAISVVFAIFLMLQQSQFIWDAIPQMAFFQYPWRFLLMTAFFTSFLSGASVWIYYKGIEQRLKGKVLRYKLFFVMKWIGVGAIILLSLLVNAKLFVPQEYLAKTVNDYINQYNLTWLSSQISSEYMPKGFSKPKDFSHVPKTKIQTLKTAVTVISSHAKTQALTAEVISSQPSDLFINQAYFPGWHAYIDGHMVWFKYFNKGLLVTIPKGRHIVSVRFSQTPIELIADTVSLASFFVLVLGIILFRKSVYETKKT